MDPLTGLSLGRIALGATTLARPDLVAMAPSPDGSRPLTLMTQAFASREIALGVLTLMARNRTRRSAALVGMLVDGIDAVTAQRAVRDGGVDPRLGHALTAVAGGAVLAGATAALGPRPKKRNAYA